MAPACKRRSLFRGLAGAIVAGAWPGTTPRAAMGGPARLTLTGQLLMEHNLCEERYPGFAAVVDELHRGHVVCSDLEVAIRTSKSGAPTREGSFLHVAEPDVLECIRAMGFNLLALANNHAWDLGTTGVLATRAAVAAAGFAAAGTGANLADASAAGIHPGSPPTALVSMAIGKIRDGAAATPERAGVNEIRMPEYGCPHEGDVARNLQAVAAARAVGEALVVVCLHNHEWGDDMAATKPWARRLAQECIDAGADVFLSHGAPLLHGIEIYRGKPLLHGLGSLVFHSRTAPGHYPPEVWESAIVHLDFAGRELSNLEIVPVTLNELGDNPARPLATRGRPHIATGADARRILERLQRLSAALGTNLVNSGTRGFLVDGGG